MPPEISLLPESDRRREDAEKRRRPIPEEEERTPSMHLPADETGEDLEVIEVDEGDLTDVLAGEPWLSRSLFQAQTWIRDTAAKLFHPRPPAMPETLPPQFVAPPPRPKGPPPGLIVIPGAEPVAAKPSATPTKPATPLTSFAPKKELPKTRVIPAPITPRRVRVIKRVRKPVSVSFVSTYERELASDVPRRRFTLVLTTAVCIALVAGGYDLLRRQGARAAENLNAVNEQVAVVEKQIADQQQTWSAYSDLEPRLRALTGLLDRHVFPTALFDALERLTLPTVYYSSLTFAQNGAVTLAATAPSFEAAAQQVVSLRDGGIATRVDAFGYQATYAETGAVDHVNFQLTLTLDPSLVNAAKQLSQTP